MLAARNPLPLLLAKAKFLLNWGARIRKGLDAFLLDVVPSRVISFPSQFTFTLSLVAANWLRMRAVRQTGARRQINLVDAGPALHSHAVYREGP